MLRQNIPLLGRLLRVSCRSPSSLYPVSSQLWPLSSVPCGAITMARLFLVFVEQRHIAPPIWSLCVCVCACVLFTYITAWQKAILVTTAYMASFFGPNIRKRIPSSFKLNQPRYGSCVYFTTEPRSHSMAVYGTPPRTLALHAQQCMVRHPCRYTMTKLCKHVGTNEPRTAVSGTVALYPSLGCCLPLPAFYRRMGSHCGRH